MGIGPFESRRREVFEVWHASIAELRRCSNVAVKLGGLGMPRTGFPFASAETPVPSEELACAWRPYVEACIESFSPARCMFESNFPVDKGMCSYPTLWNAFKRLASGYSPGERDALFYGTATRVYGLNPKETDR